MEYVQLQNTKACIGKQCTKGKTYYVTSLYYVMKRACELGVIYYFSEKKMTLNPGVLIQSSKQYTSVKFLGKERAFK